MFIHRILKILIACCFVIAFAGRININAEEKKTDEKKGEAKPATADAEKKSKKVIIVFEDENIKNGWLNPDLPDSNVEEDEYGFHLQGGTQDFQVYKIDFSRLLKNATIVSAIFELGKNIRKKPGEGTIGIYHLLTDWNEETVTYNKPWEGGPKSGKDYKADPTSSVACDSNKEKQPGFDVTTDVSAWLSGEAKNYGWILTMYGTGNAHIHTRTSRSSQDYGAGCGPKLTVIYSVPTE